ncbi:MAG: XdhC family protein [Ilumatobacteraceae bacterium]
MFGLALTTTACIRSGTDVHLVWIVQADGIPHDPNDTVALTPGGGRMGELAGGALDGVLVALHRGEHARLVDLELTPTDALVHGLSPGANARVAVVPGVMIPSSVWTDLAARRPVGLSARCEGSELSDFVHHPYNDPNDLMAPLFGAGQSGTETIGDRIATLFWPMPKLAIFGAGPIADAIAATATLIGWKVVITSDADRATGIMTDLAEIDSALVMGHDVESSSRVLGAALESAAGYIGSLGSHKLQDQRRDWLAYRGVTDVSRVRGPAGLEIQAATPEEIGVSVIAEAIMVHRSR